MTHMKGCSMSLLKEMQNKITMRYPLTPVRMAIISKSTTVSAGQDVQKGEPNCTLVRMQTGTATVKSCMEVAQKIKNWSSFWPSDLTSGNISERTQNVSSKEYKHPYVHCSIIYNRQDVEAAQVSIGRWADKRTMGHLHNGILLGCKKIKFTLYKVQMDQENIMLSEISQSEKDKYHMISLICGI